MDTSYCPICGTENPTSAAHCSSCGVDLYTEGRAELAPLRPGALATIAGAGALFVALTQWVDGLSSLAFRVRGGVPGMLFSDDGLGRLWWPSLVGLLAALGATLYTGRRLRREAALAGLVIGLAQVLLWGYAAGFSSLWGSTVNVFRGGFTLVLPSAMFLSVGIGLAALGPITGAALGSALRTGLLKRARCPHCDAEITGPTPLVCPHCRAALARGKVRWGWAYGGAAATVALYAALLQFGGAPLQFYYRCALDDQGDNCITARVEYRKAAQAEGDNPWGLIQDKRSRGSDNPGYFVMFHTWRYALYPAGVFFLVPFVLALRLRRGALPTAGMAVPLAWLGATLTALFAFDFGSFEGALLYSLREHMLDLLVWGLAGSLGAAFGYRFSASPARTLSEIS